MAPASPLAPPERESDAGRVRTGDQPGGAGERRRASRRLWAACEALLSAGDPRSLDRTLEELVRAFDCDGATLYALGAEGAIERWSSRGPWRRTAGDLRGCLSVPLHRGDERVGTLELLARPGERWSPAQLALLRTASGALGAALGARLELVRLREQPGRDRVTGLPDAKAFHARMTEETTRAQRHGVPLGVVEIDVDHFGALCGRYGRAAGERVLAEIALVLRLALRESDFVARLGDDGFGVLLPETDQLPARRVAERLRRTIEEHRFPRVGRLSVSAGVAAAPRDGVEALELMEAADRALGLAKKSGRRRVAAREAARVH